LSGRADLKLMALAPMAVAPEMQHLGVGSALVLAGLERCRELGCQAVVVLGHPDYYPRFGFVAASRFGITSEYDVPDEVFMAIELVPDALRTTRGTIQYHRAFAGW
jgi:putative acetyltransferase